MHTLDDAASTLSPPRQAAVVVKLRTSTTGGATATQAPPKRFACPHCAGSVLRIHRRWIDRLVGALIFMHVRRYRCGAPGCNWRGNLRCLSYAGPRRGVSSRFSEGPQATS